jgi:hypothetical protein
MGKKMQISSFRRVGATWSTSLVLLFGFVGAVHAKSTTTTSLTVEGVAKPGSNIVLRALVDGKHITFNGGSSAFGGNVDFYYGSEKIASQSINYLTTPVTEGPYYCGGPCVLFFGQHTNMPISFTVPLNAPNVLTFGAVFTGDNESHGSNSAIVTTGVRRLASADLYWINPTSTGSGKTEVHILDASSEYKTWKLHAATVLPLLNPDQWSFALGDYNGDGVTDLYAISRYGNGSGKVEVHIINGATNFTSFLAQFPTIVGPLPGGLGNVFDVADYNGDGKLDMYIFSRVGTGTNKTEVHVLDGATGFSTRLLDVATGLPETGTSDNFEFSVADYDGDGKPDVYVIEKQNSAQTEVHILSGASNYQTSVLAVQTGLPATGSDSRWVFGANDVEGDGKMDLFAIDKMGSTGTEVHALQGNGFVNFNLHKSTPIGALPSDTTQTLLINK